MGLLIGFARWLRRTHKGHDWTLAILDGMSQDAVSLDDTYEGCRQWADAVVGEYWLINLPVPYLTDAMHAQLMVYALYWLDGQ